MPAEKPKVSPRARTLIVAALAAVYLAVCAFSLGATRDWIGRPFPGFLLSQNRIVSIFNLSHWEGKKAGVGYKDIIAAVNGRPLASGDELIEIIAAEQPKELTYTVDKRRGGQAEITVKVLPFSLWDWLVIFPGVMLVGAALYATGLVVFWIKPNHRASWALLFLCSVYGLMDAAVGESQTNHRLFYPFIFYHLVGPSFMVLALYFPVELQRKKPIVWALILITAPILLVNLYYAKDPYLFRNVSISFYLHAHVFRLIALVIMLRSFYLSRDPRVRQQGKVAVFGFVLAFIIVIGINVASIVFHQANLIWTLLPWLIIPVAIGYAITKHNLFDVDVFIKRSLSYLLVSGAAVAVIFGLIGALSIFFQGMSGQTSQIAAIASTLVAVAVFRPLRLRVDRALDRRFFREQHQYSATLRRASGILVSIINLKELIRKLLDAVVDAIRIERGAIYLWDAEAGAFMVAETRGYPDPAVPVPLGSRHALIQHLERRGAAFQLNDVEELAEFEHNRSETIAALAELGAVLAVPIIYEGRLIGFLALGEKKSGAWYSSDDVELLQTLMIQTAVSVDNARKVEELKQMVELESRYQELRRMDELKDNFLSMVSHDLRTPMTSIKGYASILLEKLDKLPRPRQERYLGVIITEADRLTRLINDLLDLQRLEAGRMVLNLAPADLRAIARAAIDSFRGAALAKNQTIHDRLPDAPVPIKADPDRIAQVVSNLLSNATKFTPEAGQIEVRLELLATDGAPAARLTVKDSGPGISEAAQAKLFTKFQQVDKLVRDAEQGSGLGLALVRELVEAHGGQVGLESKPGEGASFFFSLKLIEQGGQADGEKNPGG